jgi:hypothetical protein
MHSVNDTKKGILVLANEAAESRVLPEAVGLALAALGDADVTIVAPALNSRTRHWTSDQEAARRAAELRLVRCVNRLAADGVYAEGWVGDAHPLHAIADAIRQVPVDLLILADHPEERSNWLARDLLDRARRDFSLPVLRIVVDHDRREERLFDERDAQRLEAGLAKAA